ncbi:hypothetical protein [Roseiconus lacunae]|uniref:Uncharacterized protein n=1 Tax=Roseiconus lacunae TaxID=2605694 RepID=A0ABT7PSB0_9BACT|nr:hypothetical protein [Roseiconus lacunae]MCD0462006.1 hypothetical protein [Roseiconus lacunae]MDM4019392.1 hypothetical protein [Roseiconus lacunae]
MLKTKKRFVLCGQPIEVVVLSPNSPLGELSYREAHLEWNGVCYEAVFILAEYAHNKIDLGEAPCGCEGKRIHVRDFKLSTLNAALDFICANDDLKRCAEISEPFDTESVWVGVPAGDSITPEQTEEALRLVQHGLLIALQRTVTFRLSGLREHEILDWIRDQCKEIIQSYDKYEESL